MAWAGACRAATLLCPQRLASVPPSAFSRESGQKKGRKEMGNTPLTKIYFQNTVHRDLRENKFSP